MPTAGVTVVGDLPDAPPPRRPARDDARPARRRARARRAGRAACGRPRRRSTAASGTGWRRSRGELELAARVLALRASRSSPRERSASSTRRRRCTALPAGLERRAARAHPACSRAHEQLVGAPDPLRGARAARAGRSASSCSSATGDPRATRCTGTSRSGRRRLELASSRSSRRSRSTAAPTAEIWRYLLDIDWAAEDHRVPPAGRPSAVLAARERRGGCGSASSTGSGRGSWTSAPRSRRAATRPTAPSCSTCVDDFCPWNAGRWRSRTASRSDRSSPQLRCDVTALGSAYLGGFTLLGARPRRSRRGAPPRRRCARGRDVRAPSAPRGAPRSSSDRFAFAGRLDGSGAAACSCSRGGEGDEAPTACSKLGAWCRQRGRSPSTAVSMPKKRLR